MSEDHRQRDKYTLVLQAQISNRYGALLFPQIMDRNIHVTGLISSIRETSSSSVLHVLEGYLVPPLVRSAICGGPNPIWAS